MVELYLIKVNSDQRLKKRITNALQVHYALLLVLKNQSVLRAEKIKIYKILLRPEVTYRAE